MARNSSEISNISPALGVHVRLARGLLEAHQGLKGLLRPSAQFSLVPDEMRVIRLVAERRGLLFGGMDRLSTIAGLTMPMNWERQRLFSTAENAPSSPAHDRPVPRSANMGVGLQAARAAPGGALLLAAQRALLPSFGPGMIFPIPFRARDTAGPREEHVDHFPFPVSLPSREEPQGHALPTSSTNHIYLDVPLNEDYVRNELIPLLERLQATG